MATTTKYVPEEELIEEARKVVDAQPMTQKRIAHMLGVQPSSVSRAVNMPSAYLTKLRIRILELAGMKVTGPYYQIHENTTGDQRRTSDSGKPARGSRRRTDAGD